MMPQLCLICAPFTTTIPRNPWLCQEPCIGFPGDIYVLFGFSSAVFWYGGWPFLKGCFEEIGSRRPGMMTLISVAVATAYLYSGAVVFGLTGKMFFWELATLVDTR
jgi:Cu2+-exporting ATPase